MEKPVTLIMGFDSVLALFQVCYIQGVLYLIFTTTAEVRNYYCSHFTNKEIEMKVICPMLRSHLAESRVTLRVCYQNLSPYPRDCGMYLGGSVPPLAPAPPFLLFQVELISMEFI